MQAGRASCCCPFLKNRNSSRFKRRRLGAVDFGDGVEVDLGLRREELEAQGTASSSRSGRRGRAGRRSCARSRL